MTPITVKPSTLPVPTPPAPATAEAGSIDDLRAALDRCAAMLDHGRPAQGLAILVIALEAARTRRTTEQWRAAVRAARSHAVIPRLHEDPYFGEVFRKVRGRAGDAQSLDYVYGHRTLPPTVTSLGRALFDISTTAPIAVAMRARSRYLSEAIQKLCLQIPIPVVVSVGCGHVRELDDIPADMLDHATIIGLDPDSDAVATVARAHGSRVWAMTASTRHLLTGRATLPPAHLIYAPTLYDQLEDRTAFALTQQLLGALRPGGMLLVPTLTPANTERAYLELVADWWMEYRDDFGMQALGIGAIPPGRRDDFVVSTRTLVSGRVACLEVRAVGGGARHLRLERD